ncbi:hypothetical protein T492DRAFT_858580 [Pavlovales sp. CCMP2436]|nr:hypothetical protein T492DRAFT_858580 [Pavlovales sp. CCMP2436]
MWNGNHPRLPEIALFDCVYNNSDDYFVCKLRLDYASWAEQSKAETDEELRVQDLGFFKDELAHECVCGRVALSVLMCIGNFCKKALVFKGKGNNGKSGFVSRLKHIFRTVNALGQDSKYRWVSESTADNLWHNKGEINVSLAEALQSKLVLLEEGLKIKVEPFKRFTGEPGSAGGARRPYQCTTHSVENHCVPIFNVNGNITRDTGSLKLPVGEAELNRMEEMNFNVTNYHSVLKLESELRKWAAAAARGVQLSPGDLASVAHHELHLESKLNFDEEAAREELGRYHRHNTLALITAFIYMAGLCRKYHFEGGEDSLVPLEIDSVAEALASAPPDTIPDKIALFCKTELVADITKCVKAPEMLAAVADYFKRNGEPPFDRNSKASMAALAATTKSTFDTAYNWMAVRGTRHKIRPAFEMCTLSDPTFKNQLAYCRVTLAPVAPLPEAEAVPTSQPEAEQAVAAAETAFFEEAMDGFELLKDELGESGQHGVPPRAGVDSRGKQRAQNVHECERSEQAERILLKGGDGVYLGQTATGWVVYLGQTATGCVNKTLKLAFANLQIDNRLLEKAHDSNLNNDALHKLMAANKILALFAKAHKDSFDSSKIEQLNKDVGYWNDPRIGGMLQWDICRLNVAPVGAAAAAPAALAPYASAPMPPIAGAPALPLAVSHFGGRAAMQDSQGRQLAALAHNDAQIDQVFAAREVITGMQQPVVPRPTEPIVRTEAVRKNNRYGCVVGSDEFVAAKETVRNSEMGAVAKGQATLDKFWANNRGNVLAAEAALVEKAGDLFSLLVGQLKSIVISRTGHLPRAKNNSDGALLEETRGVILKQPITTMPPAPVAPLASSPTSAGSAAAEVAFKACSQCGVEGMLMADHDRKFWCSCDANLD